MSNISKLREKIRDSIEVIDYKKWMLEQEITIKQYVSEKNNEPALIDTKEDDIDKTILSRLELIDITKNELARVVPNNNVPTLNIDGIECAQKSAYSFALVTYINARHFVIIGDKAGPVHAHSWQLQIDAHVPTDKAEILAFTTVADQVKKAIAIYDNKVLNDIHPFNQIQPTTENITLYMFNRIEDLLNEVGLLLEKVTLWETPTRGIKVTCRYTKFDEIIQIEGQTASSRCSEDKIMEYKDADEPKEEQNKIDNLRRIALLIKNPRLIITLLAIALIVSAFEFGINNILEICATGQSGILVACVIIWGIIAVFFYKNHIWLFYYIWGAVGLTLLLLTALKGSPIEIFTEQHSRIIIQYVLKAIHLIPESYSDTFKSLTAFNKLTDTWTSMGIDIETSGLLEIYIFTGLILFYPGYNIKTKLKYLLVGTIATYIINLVRMITIASAIRLGGGDFLSFGPLVIGRLLHFVLTITLYWEIFTKPTLKVIWERVQND